MILLNLFKKVPLISALPKGAGALKKKWDSLPPEKKQELEEKAFKALMKLAAKELSKK